MTDTLKQRAEKSDAEFVNAVGDASASNALMSTVRWIGEARAVIYEQAERIKGLEAQLSNMFTNHTHRCMRCSHEYTPEGIEDCPKCGCNGELP